MRSFVPGQVRWLTGHSLRMNKLGNDYKVALIVTVINICVAVATCLVCGAAILVLS